MITAKIVLDYNNMSFSNRLTQLNEKANGEADITVLGHAKYGEMKACAEFVKTGAGHHPPLVRAKIGK